MQFHLGFASLGSVGVLLTILSGCSSGSEAKSDQASRVLAPSVTASPSNTAYQQATAVESQGQPASASSAASSRYPADPGRILSRVPHPAGGKKASAVVPQLPLPDLIPNPPDSTPLASPIDLKAPEAYPTLAPKVQGFVSNQGIKELADYYQKTLPGIKLQEVSKADQNTKILMLPANKEGCVSITLMQKNGKTVVLKTIMPNQIPKGPNKYQPR